jgi:type I restriction enzyme R subunit
MSLKKLLGKAAALTLTEDETATLASRLAKLELDLTPEERVELDGVSGKPVKQIVQALVAAVDPDEQAKAVAVADLVDGIPDTAGAIQRLIDAAVEPIAANPELRERILELRAQHDQVIDEITVDQLLDAHGVVDTDKARSVVASWTQYLADHRDEISALQVLYSQPAGSRISYDELRELADRIRRPPHNWTPDLIWNAYGVLDSGKIFRSGRRTVTDLVSLVRYTLGRDVELEPYAAKVQWRYEAWLAQQEQAGAVFSERQRWWLDRIADVIATSTGIAVDDLDNAPFLERGGVDGAISDLGSDAERYLDELNTELTA